MNNNGLREKKHLAVLETFKVDIGWPPLAILPTLFRPNQDVPYLWLVAGRSMIRMFSTLKKKPIFMEMSYADIDSVELVNNIITIRSRSSDGNNDKIIPIEVQYSTDAQTFVEVVRKMIHHDSES